MESIEIEGSSIDEAVERACDALNTNRENLEYEIVETQGQNKRKVKIIAKKREASEASKSLSPFALKAKEILEHIVKSIDSEYSVNVFEYPDKLMLNINGDGSGLLIGKRGQTLDAIQHIVVKMVSRTDEADSNKKIIIDTEKYREKRIEYLKELAVKLADKVRQNGQPVSVNPMSSFERRIIHVSLDAIDGIYTESVGEGPERKVMILPQGSSKRSTRSPRNR